SHLTTSGFYFIPRHAGTILFGVPLDSPLCLLFIATYYQTFLILAYHFVFRFKTVTKFLQKSYTDKWRPKHWIIIGIIVYVFYIATFIVITAMEGIPNDYTRAHVPPSILQLYGKDLRDPNIGYTCIAIKVSYPTATHSDRQCAESTIKMCWHFPMIASVVGLMALFGATAAVIGYCMYQTSAAIRYLTKTLNTQIDKQLSSAENETNAARFVQCVVNSDSSAMLGIVCTLIHGNCVPDIDW
ncbi:hypothetical protein PRIPAC_70810, partial [Pristionchus pacificus]|uniref:G protein-coupled receptor n=1 Tax=Pristionchus pacificus TaxID=54126 RepID=A0A2A6C665_PRIPA